MSRTLTALFDTRADAEAGRQRLIHANVDADNIKIHDKSSIGETGYSSREEPGMWASIKNAFLPDEDRHVYEEGVRRGGFLLTADIDSDDSGEAIRALEDVSLNSIDVDERASQWKSQGWNPPSAGTAAGSAGERGLRVRSYGADKPGA
ncbi:hypothetical protein [Massilia sp. LjRoot122]|uniref:hypothetical protein n=1 Tax=Massilia sp. LjRoot122 TaxID=3342257 RepID=UPI003ECCB909